MDSVDGSTSIMAISVEDPSADLISHFGGSPSDYPFKSAVPKKWTKIAYTVAAGCPQNVPGTFVSIIEQEVCYSNHESDISKRMSQKVSGTDMTWFNGDGCHSDSVAGSQSLQNTNACFQDMFSMQYGYARILESNIGANSLNISHDLVSSFFCHYF